MAAWRSDVAGTRTTALGPFEAVRELTFDAPFPRMFPVRQRFDAPEEPDVAAAVHRELEPLRPALRSGMQIAVTAGSRGITDIATVVRAVGEWLRAAGTQPLVVPAMGSHGRATAEGQVALLASLGITEETMGMPVRATMETVELDRLAGGGPPVHLDAYAAGADGILVVNRVKPHTDFAADVESGLAKITAIGLGKQRGAEAIHAHGAAGLARWVPAVARRMVEKSNVLGGIAIVENAFERTAKVAFVPPDGIGGQREAELLTEASDLMARLPFDELEVLVLDEFGKNKSGSGVDTNVVGRMLIRDTAELPRPWISNIVARDLTDPSHGNAAGIGLLDFIPFRMLEKIDLRATYINSATAGIAGVQRAQLPFVLPTDKDAIAAAMRMSGRADLDGVRLVRARSTLELEELSVSESLRDEVERHPRLEVLGEPVPMAFDADGSLT